MSVAKHAILETISPSRSDTIHRPETIQLIQSMVDEHCYALNGIEGYAGMKWGELRKWEDNPINSMKLQPSLFTLLKRKDLIILPAKETLRDIQDYITYNDKHPDNRIHFLKRFPPGEYEYALLASTVYSDPIFAQNTDGEIVEHSAPYFNTLIFKSRAHPWLVTAFARWKLYETHLGVLFDFEDDFPIDYFDSAATSPQPLNFYCQPYLGWTPRSLPDHIEEQLSRKRSAGTTSLKNPYTSSSSSSSSRLERPCKRTKHRNICPSRFVGQQNQRISAWRCHVYSAGDVSIASDEGLRAYAMEAARLVRDALSHDPTYQKFVTTSKIAINHSSSLRRKRACPNVH